MTTAAATGAEEQAQTDSESTDDITLVLSKLADIEKIWIFGCGVNVTYTKLVDEQAAEDMVKAIERLDQLKSIREFIDEYMVFER
jgi:hypothetical protein